MGEREIREKYGGKLDKAINRAIRAEIPEGNAALDTLEKLSGPAAHSGWTDPDGQPTPAAVAYFRHKHNVVDRLIAKVRQNWNLPPAKPPTKKAKAMKRPHRKRSGG